MTVQPKLGQHIVLLKTVDILILLHLFFTQVEILIAWLELSYDSADKLFDPHSSKLLLLDIVKAYLFFFH